MSLGDWGELGKTQSQGGCSHGPEEEGTESSGRVGRVLCFLWGRGYAYS